MMRNRSLVRSSRYVHVLMIQAGILLLLGGCSLVYSAYSLEAEALIYPACVSLALVSVWSVFSWNVLTKRSFDPYILFIIAAVLFNGGQAFLEIFHLNDQGVLKSAFSSETTLQTLFLVTVCLSTFHFGAILSTLTVRIDDRRREADQETLIALGRNSRRIGVGLVMISSVPALWNLRQALALVISSGYFALYQRDVVTSFAATPQVLAGFLVPGGLFLLASSKNNRSMRLASVALIVMYSATQLFLGSRSAAFLPLFALLWLWHSAIRPLPRSLFIVGGAVLLFVAFPLVAVVRNVTGANRSSVDFLVNAYASIDNPAVSAVSEMGGTMGTIAHTINLVPSYRNYDMGVGYLYALLTAIPNLFWSIHPTIAHGLPSSWLVWTIDPQTAAHGGGLGYSFIAEAYLNFGWLGGPLFLGFIGFLYGKLILWAVPSSNPAKLAMVAVFLSFFLFYVRQEAASQIRSLLWYAVLPYICVNLLERRIPHKRPTRTQRATVTTSVRGATFQEQR
ncbi:MAG: O-antigen polysaccharide polymerase Wzy [Herpetosiphonaceae bacterium]|nr:O-antigen polysaccharide polymerase Wzy [Herpetosiphonaceae bacterium]